ncbi:MAG: class I SAM-dependent RNA methyltransferase, partial [Clostridia bacterium]|nr:class I SAM-dependent RNA methyltransferase [Clostridia bacterium]
MMYRFIATCKLGLESVVAEELRSLDIEIESVSDAKVVFCGDHFTMARSCLWLRTAERVLQIIGEFPALSFE